jgi:hypothetical protein
MRVAINYVSSKLTPDEPAVADTPDLISDIDQASYFTTRQTTSSVQRGENSWP